MNIFGLKLTNPFKGRQPGANAPPPPPNQPPQNNQQPPSGPSTGVPPTTNKTDTPTLESVDGGKLDLVNYPPQALMQHVEHTLSTVHFGMSAGEHFKEWMGEVWDIIGPMVLLAGTAGEVFFFIWNNAESPAWWVALSILATVIVLEATFMVTSYKSSTIRNRAESRVGGKTDQDKAALRRYRDMWVILAFGVGTGQVAFLVSAMNTRMELTWLILFAVARTFFTLASDYYTAFAHIKKPTDGDEAKRIQKERADLAKDLLNQKTEEVQIINDGAIRLQRAHAQAEQERDNVTTELEMQKMENQNRIHTMRIMQEQASMFTMLGQNIMRALFDPSMPDDQREKLISTMQAFMQTGRYLPGGPQTHVEMVTEEDER